MNTTRNISLLALVLLVLLSFISTRAQQPFSFAFMADIHFDGSEKRTANLLKAIDLSKSHNCNFIITGGDNVDAEACFVHQDSATGCYEHYDSIMRLSKMPVYSVVGNHDRYLFTKTDDQNYNTGLFRTHTGHNDYYSFDNKGWHFIIINNVCFTDNPFEYRVSNEQIKWIAEDLLKTGNSTPTVVIVHVPMVSLWKSFINKNKHRKKILKEYRELWDQFEDYNIKAVLQGHYHISKSNTIGEVAYITGGAVNTSWWSGLFNTKPGFIVMTCNGEEFSYYYNELDEE